MDQDRAIRNMVQEILVMIDQAGAAYNVIESIFCMNFTPDLDFVEEI
jgi:hypothetical protein